MSIQTIINQSSTQSLYSTRREDGCQGAGKGRAAKASAGRGQEIIRKTVAVKGDSIELSRDSSFRSVSWYEEDVSGYDMHLIDDAGVGATLEEIAGWICSGIPNRNIETRYLDYLRRVDPDLYYAAQNIGREVRNYDMMTEAYKGGLIGDAQHDYDLGLLAMLFGKTGDEDFYRNFIAAKKTGDYSYFLENYSPKMSERLLDIRLEQTEKTGGIL